MRIGLSTPVDYLWCGFWAVRITSCDRGPPSGGATPALSGVVLAPLERKRGRWLRYIA